MMNPRTVLAIPRRPRRPGRRLARRGLRSFLLLEVIVSMVIIGIALAAVLRCYTNALKALSRERDVTTAVLIAQSLLENFEIAKPQEERVDAWCEPDFPDFFYVAEFETEEVEYRDIDIGFDRPEFHDLTKVTLRIYHQRPSQREAQRLLYIETYLMGIEKYARQTKSMYGLY